MLIINDATIDAIAPQISLPDSSSAYVEGVTVKTTWQAATCEWTTTSKEY